MLRSLETVANKEFFFPSLEENQKVGVGGSKTEPRASEFFSPLVVFFNLSFSPVFFVFLSFSPFFSIFLLFLFLSFLLLIQNLILKIKNPLNSPKPPKSTPFPLSSILSSILSPIYPTPKETPPYQTSTQFFHCHLISFHLRNIQPNYTLRPILR